MACLRKLGRYIASDSAVEPALRLSSAETVQPVQEKGSENSNFTFPWALVSTQISRPPLSQTHTRLGSLALGEKGARNSVDTNALGESSLRRGEGLKNGK